MKCKDPDHFRSDDVTAMDAEMIEIDENLCRAELTTAQRSAAIKRRREIWAAMHPDGVSSQVGTEPSKGGRPVEFATDTAGATGESRSSVYRHLARADALGDDLEAVVGTSLDKGEHLAKRKEVWEAMEAVRIQVGQVDPPVIGYGNPPPQTEGFASATAAVTGKSKESINRAVRLEP